MHKAAHVGQPSVPVMNNYIFSHLVALPLINPSLHWPVGTYGQPFPGSRACSHEYPCF